MAVPRKTYVKALKAVVPVISLMGMAAPSAEIKDTADVSVAQTALEQIEKGEMLIAANQEGGATIYAPYHAIVYAGYGTYDMTDIALPYTNCGMAN